MIANYPAVKPHLLPYIDEAKEDIHWDKMGYGGLSGGVKTAISWAYCIWTDRAIPSVYLEGNPKDDDSDFIRNWRDPFEGFGAMDSELQMLCLNALAHRHQTLKGVRTSAQFRNIMEKKMREDDEK